MSEIMPLSTTVQSALFASGIKNDSRMLIGVSGGVDSMVLLHVLYNLGYAIAVSHVNFQLRAEDSDMDAALVRHWCSEHKVEYYEHAVNTKEYAETNRMNIQSAAREIRYNIWEDLQKKGFDAVITAHHKNDNMETFFINLFRGTGIKGLAGIPSKRGLFVRPMLEVSRSMIEEYALQNNIPFRTDLSNLTDAYLRNHIRHHMIPLLREYASDPENLLSNTLPRIRLEWEAWEYSFKRWESDQVVEINGAYMLNATVEEHPFLLRWLEEKGLPWPLAHDYIKSNSSNKGNVLEHNSYILSRTKDGFHLDQKQNPTLLKIYAEGKYSFGQKVFSIERITKENFSITSDKNIEFISADIVHWPLTIRPVSHGDYFQPFGMNGQTKKLQDFLVDHHLDYYEKRNTLVLTSDENIIWVIGMRLDERARVTVDNGEVYRLKIVDVRK